MITFTALCHLLFNIKSRKISLTNDFPLRLPVKPLLIYILWFASLWSWSCSLRAGPITKSGLVTSLLYPSGATIALNVPLSWSVHDEHHEFNKAKWESFGLCDPLWRQRDRVSSGPFTFHLHTRARATSKDHSDLWDYLKEVDYIVGKRRLLILARLLSAIQKKRTISWRGLFIWLLLSHSPFTPPFLTTP